METADSIEGLLRRAFTPVEPPAELEARLERTLDSLVALAADELESWELSAMRDPRNWPAVALRPAAAVAVGSAAAVGLVAVRTRHRRHKRRAASSNALDLAGRTVRDALSEAGRLADRAPRRR